MSAVSVGKSEKVRLQLLFALFGMGLMCFSPRLPDLKANLGVNNGTFGTLLSLGVIGSMVSLLTMGQLVHKFGVKKTLFVSSTAMYLLIASVPHVHSPMLYVVFNICIGASFSAYNIAIHTQILHRQEESGEILLPRAHGAWSIGVLATAILALFITDSVSFAVHVDTMIAIIWVITFSMIYSLRETFILKSEEPVTDIGINLAKLKRTFTFDKSIIVFFILAGMLEFSSNDWSTLVTYQEIGAAKSLSALSYLALIFGMILGRWNFDKLVFMRSERFWIRTAAIYGGIGFIVLTQSARMIADTHLNLALALEVLGFFVGGLGTSFMAPLATNIANRRSSQKPSEVVAQMNLTNGILAFFAKLIVSWVAQATSITTALLIPGLMLVLASRFAYLGHPYRHRK
jgi:hypothetical protein